MPLLRRLIFRTVVPKMADDADDIFHRSEKKLVITGAFEHSADDKQVDRSRVLIVSGGSNLLTA